MIDKGTRSPAVLDPEADADGFFATIWLHRPLPDPTPPAKRLNRGFADMLAREAKRAKVDWALVLGVLRARGFDGSTMGFRPVRTTAVRLAELGARRQAARALRAYGGAEFADQALALRDYNRAVGLRALVVGLEAAKPRLQHRLLRDKSVTVYPGGRLDLALGRVDVRVIVLLRYLRQAHKQVTVSSLISGHRLYSRPGVISAHIYGLAVDIAVLDHRSIYGNQEPGGLTQKAVENILQLPAELQPKQVISSSAWADRPSRWPTTTTTSTWGTKSPLLVSLERQDGSLVCERCLLAETPLTRARGLLGRAGLERGEGILLRPASSIHMWFMRFAIDAAFLDPDGRVLRIAEHLRPWRLAACKGAKAVVELPRR